MEATDSAENFIPAGLASLGIEADEVDLAGHHMAEITTLIVSGPLCADAADCRLLGSVLFGEELSAAWGRDELLLDAAEALERASGRRWVESLPPLARPQAEPTEA